MRTFALLFLLLLTTLACLIFLTLQQTPTVPSESQPARYSPSAIPSQPTDREQRFDFVAYGDARNGHEKHRKLVQHIIALNPDLVVSTGDLVEHGRKDEEWHTFWEIIQPLAENIPYYTVRGNHDRGRDNYEKRFAPPNDSGTDRYYSFHYKNVHFIGLDTNESVGKMSAQQYWLKKELAATDKSHIIVFFHYPPFGITKGRGDNARIKKAFHQLFVKHKVNLVLAGHDHLYYRTHRNGVTYVTTGGGGAPLYHVDEELPRLSSDVWGEYNHLVHFTITGGLIKGTMIDIDGKIRDSFTIPSRQISALRD